MKSLTSLLTLSILLASPAYAADSKSTSVTSELQQVAEFDHEVTGVTVTEKGRIFVNFPRWTDDAPISVAEVMKDGTIKAYPDADWNAWRNTKKNKLTPNDHFVCVQSVVADGRGSLWVLDPAAPAMEKIVPGGPKLVQIDLASNKVVKTIPFNEGIAPMGAYLNDVRLGPDGKWAYITESGKGAIVVVDLENQKARRLLDGHKTTKAEKDVQVKTDGKVLKRPDGRGAEISADGIELSKDGKYLYWQALTGKTFYRIPTDALQNPDLSPKDVEGRIETVGQSIPADGLWLDQKGRFYVSAIEENAVKIRNGDNLTTIVQDDRLRWPDTFSEGPDGMIYVTSSRIMDNAFWKPANGPTIKTSLWKFKPPAQ